MFENIIKIYLFLFFKSLEESESQLRGSVYINIYLKVRHEK